MTDKPNDGSMPRSQAKYEHAAVAEGICPHCQTPLVPVIRQDAATGADEEWLNCPSCSDEELVKDWYVDPGGAYTMRLGQRDSG